MKKIITLFLLTFALIGCQSKQEESITPINKANAREGVKDGISLDKNIMTATIIARRGESDEVIKKRLMGQMTTDKKRAFPDDEIVMLIKYCQQVFQEKPRCQAIFRDADYFGYIKEFPKDRTELKGVRCDKCKENGVVIVINPPKGNSTNNMMERCCPVSAWLTAIFN
jgi:hypothetical protein